MEQQKKTNKGSKKAQSSAARLAAVQALYQMEGNDQSARSAVREYLDFRLGQPVDGIRLVQADRELFTHLVTGVEQRRADLDTIIGQTLGAREQLREPLLQAILFCGAYELMSRLEVDAPIIISDYMHVTDAFFDQGEKKLVNAVLDKIAKAVRD